MANLELRSTNTTVPLRSVNTKHQHQQYLVISCVAPQCYDEAVIEEMTEDREMLTNPDLVEARKELKTVRGENPLVAQKMMKFDPSKSNILSTLAAEEGQKVTRTA